MPTLATDLFDYELPDRLIAQVPTEKRDQSRLLVVDRASRQLSHHRFSELPQFLRTGDLLFRNNASVLPARLYAQRATGGLVECFLLRPVDGESVWRCLVRPGKKLAVGATFSHVTGDFVGEIRAKETDGSALVHFTTRDGEPIVSVAKRLGELPLPPYIQRSRESPTAEANQRNTDLDRYQTVYADPTRQVAVAAPTAGLHFTPELLRTLDDQGVKTENVTLHVGLGTFKPIATASVEEHAIHRELYELPVATQQALFPPLTGRRIAIGTTTVRSIEDFLSSHAHALEHPHLGEAGIFIYPPRSFRGIDALITNFHQPRSTLLCLVSAFLTPGSISGVDWIRDIYAEAIAREYRFFSYGDAMLIL